MPSGYQAFALIEQVWTTALVEGPLGGQERGEQLLRLEAALDPEADGVAAGQEVDRGAVGDELVLLGAPAELPRPERPQLAQDGHPGAVRPEGGAVHDVELDAAARLPAELVEHRPEGERPVAHAGEVVAGEALGE